MNFLKKTSLALAIAAAMPLSAVAQETNESFDTFLSAGYSNSRYDGSSSRQGGGEFRFSTSYTHPSGFGGQVDTVYSNLKLGSFQDGSLSASTTDFAGHIYFRNKTGLIGLFGQRRTFDTNFNSSDPSADLSADASLDLLVKDRTFFGLEGEGYFGDLTIAAQGGKQRLGSPLFEADTGLKSDGNFASVEARYFLEDNWKITTRYSYGKLSGEVSASDVKSQSIGIGTEYRFADSPISAFLNVDQMRSESGGSAYDSNRVMIGAKLNFGKNTLKARDRNGASLNPVGLDNLLTSVINSSGIP